MRAQLSLELLTYMALAGLSFLFALTIVARASGKIDASMHIFEIGQFVDYVNTELFYGSNASFSTFLPQGLCSSNVTNSSVTTGYGIFYFAGSLRLTENALCPDGAYSKLEILYNASGAYLLREG